MNQVQRIKIWSERCCFILGRRLLAGLIRNDLPKVLIGHQCQVTIVMSVTKAQVANPGSPHCLMSPTPTTLPSWHAARPKSSYQGAQEQAPREAHWQSVAKPWGVQQEARGTARPSRVAFHTHTSVFPLPAPANLPWGSSSCVVAAVGAVGRHADNGCDRHAGRDTQAALLQQRRSTA